MSEAYYPYFRRPKTLNEMKSFFDAIDSGVKVRARRNPNGLPNNWSDIHCPGRKTEPTRRQRIQSRRSYRQSIRRGI